MSTRIFNPFPLFWNKGLPLDGGKAYFGADSVDPEVTPMTVYLDAALTVVAPQPISIIGGILTYAGNPAQIYTGASSYSIRVRDADGAQVFYEPSAIILATTYQPLDADLTAIAALTTTSFGRALLTKADGPSVKTYLGVIDPTKQQEFISFAVSDETTALTTGTSKITYRVPYAITLSKAKASLSTAQTSGSPLTIDIKKNGTTIFSTKPTFDNTEKSTETAAAPSVLSVTSLAADDELTIDITQVGDGTARGLKVTIIGTQP